MHLGPARAIVVSAVLAISAVPLGCVEKARCDAALEGVAHARAEGDRRDRQLAWLGLWQAQLAAQVQVGVADAEREALRRRASLLEAENAVLAARVERAERRPAGGEKRRLDPSVPYDLTRLLTRPPVSGKHEGSIFQRATRPSRRLDTVVPYELAPGAVTRAPSPAAPPATRTLDEDVPY